MGRQLHVANKWPLWAGPVLVIIISVLVLIITSSMQTFDVLADKTKKPSRHLSVHRKRPVIRPKNHSNGKFHRTTLGIISKSNVINSLVALYLPLPINDELEPGSFAGMAIALDKQHMMIDVRVRTEATREMKKALAFQSDAMTYRFPAPSIIDTTVFSGSNHPKLFWKQVKNFGTFSIIAIEESPFALNSTIEIATDQRRANCILYSWSRDPSDVNSKGRKFKYFVEHEVFVVKNNCDCDVCDLRILGDAGYICPFGPDYGSPIFCGGKLSYLVFHIGEIGAGECLKAFKGVNLHYYANAIKKAIGKT